MGIHTGARGCIMLRIFVLSYTCHTQYKVKCHAPTGNVNGIWLYPSHNYHTCMKSSFHLVYSPEICCSDGKWCASVINLPHQSSQWKCHRPNFLEPSTWREVLLVRPCSVWSSQWCTHPPLVRSLRPSRPHHCLAWRHKKIVVSMASRKYVGGCAYTHTQFLAARSRCTNLWKARYSIPREICQQNRNRSFFTAFIYTQKIT